MHMTPFRAGHELAAITTNACHARNENIRDVCHVIQNIVTNRSVEGDSLYPENELQRNQLHHKECFKFSF